MVRVHRLHVINGSRILLTFDTGELLQVDVRAALGEASFREHFPTQDAFAAMHIEIAGGIIWDNGFVIGGPVLYESALHQARESVR